MTKPGGNAGNSLIRFPYQMSVTRLCGNVGSSVNGLFIQDRSVRPVGSGGSFDN